jgi:hypothetical protein
LVGCIAKGSKNPLNLSNVNCGRLVISRKTTSVTLVNCWIGRLSFTPDGSVESLILNDCDVGRLQVIAGSITDFSMNGGTILELTSPAPGGEGNPFKGSVNISDETWFATHSKQTSLHRGAQKYRCLRSFMEDLQNAPMAARMRALELKAERETDTGLTRVTNWIYAITAGYGLRPGLPLLWGLLIYALMAGGVYVWDHGALPLPDERYVGAYAAFADPECGRLWRSVFLPFQSIGLPFTFFNPNKLVVAEYGLTTAFLFTQGLVTDILIFISIISLRRRFKFT